jgi:hypothetical protein
MRIKKLIIVIVILVAIVASFFAGHYFTNSMPLSAPETVYQETPTIQHATTGTAILYGKIKKIESKNNGGNITLNLVEWVQGSDNQEQAALETGFCSLEKIEKDECLPNGFYVRNTAKQLTLPVSADVNIQALSAGPDGKIAQDASNNTIPRKISLSDLVSMIKNTQDAGAGVLFVDLTPFIFTTTNGIITEIQEQYIP